MKIITRRQLRDSSQCLRKFIERVFSNQNDLEQSFIMSMNSKMNKGVFSIDDENGLAVVATTHQSTWHPHCIYVRLAYDLKCVDFDSIKLMIDELKKQFDKPLFFLIDNRFEYLKEVLLNKGLRFIRKTEVISIAPQKREMVSMDRKVIAISEITNDPILITSFVELCKRIYTETHLDNPVGVFPLTSWESIIMNELNVDNSYVVINENKVTAFSLMYEVDEQNWELGWIGVENPAQMNLLDVLITKQIQDATKLGIIAIEKEVDSTCPYSLHIAASLSNDVSKTLYSFISK